MDAPIYRTPALPGHERQGLNHAARPDRPIAFSGRTLCIFCGRGNRLGIGGKIVLVMQTPSASQTGNTDGAVSFGGTTFSDSPLPVVDQPALLCKTGAVAGAIPRVLLRVPFQRAAEMGTTLGGRGQEVDHGLEAIDTNWGRRIVLEGENTSA